MASVAAGDDLGAPVGAVGQARSISAAIAIATSILLAGRIDALGAAPAPRRRLLPHRSRRRRSYVGLEQLPHHPGVMMAWRTAATQLGYLLGAVIGGAVIAGAGYGALGIVLAACMTASALLAPRAEDTLDAPSGRTAAAPPASAPPGARVRVAPGIEARR
jgi:predicted MFS family arabinose efflux permease